MGEAKRRGGPVPAPFRYARAGEDAAIAAGIPVVVGDVAVRRPPGPGFDPLRYAKPPELHAYLAQRLPSAPPAARWRICGGYVVRLHDAGDGVVGATVAFRLPAEPHYALLTLVSRQSRESLSALQRVTSTDGVTLTGAFVAGDEGPPALVGIAEPFDEDHARPKPGTLTLLLPDWDDNAFARILRPYGLDVRAS